MSQAANKTTYLGKENCSFAEWVAFTNWGAYRLKGNAKLCSPIRVILVAGSIGAFLTQVIFKMYDKISWRATYENSWRDVSFRRSEVDNL